MMSIARTLLVLALCAFASRVGAQPAPPPPPMPGEASSTASTQPPGTQQAGAAPCDRCGKVEAIRQASTQTQWQPLGTLPSATAAGSDLNPSAISAFRIGKDLTNQGQVMIGAAGGAAYQARPPPQRNATRWEIVVRMDDASARSVTQNYEPLLQVGDRVRVFGTQVELVQ
jgi:outer membrane lipoprotein SlyB